MLRDLSEKMHVAQDMILMFIYTEELVLIYVEKKQVILSRKSDNIISCIIEYVLFTGLLESLEGRQGKPRLKPPFPANTGLYGNSIVNWTC